jgi:hypothetical protein
MDQNDVNNSWLFSQDEENYNRLRNSSCEAEGGNKSFRDKPTIETHLSYAFQFFFTNKNEKLKFELFQSSVARK